MGTCWGIKPFFNHGHESKHQNIKTEPESLWICATYTGETWCLVCYPPVPSSHTPGRCTGCTRLDWTDVSNLYTCLSSHRCLWLSIASNTGRTQFSGTESDLRACACCDAPSALLWLPLHCGAPYADACHLGTKVHHLKKQANPRRNKETNKKKDLSWNNIEKKDVLWLGMLKNDYSPPQQNFLLHLLMIPFEALSCLLYIPNRRYFSTSSNLWKLIL